MNINVVKIHFKDKELGGQYAYKYLPFEYCCDKLKNLEHIEFCAELDAINSNDGIDDEGNVIPRFAFYADESQPWEDDTWPTYYKIDYCPFCGEKININLKKEVDKSKLYTELTNSCDAFKEAMQETDSVKTQKRLEEEIREVTRKINNMWEFGKYDE